MSRIEDALHKLQRERRAGPAGSAATERRAAAVAASETLRAFTLNTTQRVKLSAATLNRRGVRAWAEDRGKREFGQIKRPLIDRAAGRLADHAVGGTIVLVTSAAPGEGKSLTTFNLALSMAAERDFSVLLVDADTIKPDLSTALGLASSHGLTNLLADGAVPFEEAIWKTSVDGLYFMPAGTERSDAAELLGSQRMRQVVQRLVEDLPHTLVLIDSSPLLLTNESPVLAALAGQVVFVVRANRTPRALVLEALNRLDPSKPIGLVLNGASAPEANYYYGQYGGAKSGETANDHSAG